MGAVGRENVGGLDSFALVPFFFFLTVAFVDRLTRSEIWLDANSPEPSQKSSR